MFSSKSNLLAVIGDFHPDRMLRYSMFVPRLYRRCKSLLKMGREKEIRIPV